MATNRQWRFRLQRSFFGLDDQYIEMVYDQIFHLKYHGHWGFMEAYNLPIKIRAWFLQRLIRQIEEEAKQMEKSRRK